jgi:ketosteroid isomerase-like protein
MTRHDTPARPDTDADAELAHVEQAFNRAMVSNDVERIRACITDDWVLVTPEVGPVSAERILHVIATGELRHDTMTKDAGRVRVYGDMAVVTARGQNTGEFRGQPQSADEWVTDVYRRIDGQWRCVLTHLTPAAGPRSGGPP